MRISSVIKLAIVKEVLGKEKSISALSREYHISRKTIYQWLKSYRSARTRKKPTCLQNRYAKGANHPRGYRLALKNRCLRAVIKQPWASITSLSQTLQAGRHAVYNLLKELNLTHPLDRQNFARLYNAPKRLHLDIKAEVVRAVMEEGKSITQVGRQYHLARKTIYAWIKAYKQQGHIQENYVHGLEHPRAISTQIRDKILNNIVRRPEISIHELTAETKKYFSEKLVKPFNLPLSTHGVWRVLKEHGLTHRQARLLYSQTKTRGAESILRPFEPLDRVKSVFETFTPQTAPAPPSPAVALAQEGQPDLHVIPEIPEESPVSRQIILKFLIRTIWKGILHVFKYPFTLEKPIVSLLIAFAIPLGVSFLFAGLVGFVNIFISASTFTQNTGYVFASLALTFGLFFFLYSFKYYLSVALVLLFSRRTSDAGQTREMSADLRTYSQHEGLIPDVSAIPLDRHPYVSIHVPLYNEKRVVNRLLEAVTSMDYDNFEVIVCDDSTDETKDIVLEWQNHPKVKISHRDSRAGFKGAALQEALKIMDPRTEFVLVFDADFLPFPDSIEQFLKYFKVRVGSLEKEKYSKSDIAVVQGYQWHVLNKSENWITRGVRTEYAGSYVVERSSSEIYQGLKQIAGSVFMIRSDIIKRFGWGTSITEDFQLTLRLYEAGYKVLYTPYVQAPSECVSTIKRLVRQRMRWAEGHSHNIKKMFWRIIIGNLESNKVDQRLDKDSYIKSNITFAEKLEFFYLAPYYLQSAFFLAGTFFWFVSETVFKVRLPFWTEVWGWSLVLTNLLSLPLMNTVGMFLEDAEEKDYIGVLSFIGLTYIVAPFQAYASIKGFIEKEEGPWFRTPKTGKITDSYRRGKFFRWLSGIFSKPSPATASRQSISNQGLALTGGYSPDRHSYNDPGSLKSLKGVKGRVLAKMLTVFLLLVSITVTALTQQIGLTPQALKIGGTVKESGQSPVTDAITLKSDKRDFTSAEIPRFILNIDKAKLHKPGKAALGINPVFAVEEDVRTQVFYNGQETGLKPELNKRQDGKFDITLPKPNSFKPGRYVLKTSIISGNEVYEGKQDFTWGVLVINTNKSMYRPNETALLGFGVLDDKGNTICDAELEVKITLPDNRFYLLATEKGTIKRSGLCSSTKMHFEADYTAKFLVEGVGKYILDLTAKTQNGEKRLADSFEVKENIPFDIERTSFPTRIYP